MLSLLVAVSAWVAHAEDTPQPPTDEQTQSQEDVDKLEADAEKIQSETKELKAQTEKVKLDIQTLKDLREEKNKKLLDLGAQRDAAALELKELEAQRRQAEAELNQAKEDEKVFNEKNLKALEDLKQRKAKMTAEVTGMKNQTDGIKRTLASQSSMESQMLVTKECKYYASPTKSPQILGSKPKGATVNKVAEGSNWIAFPLSNNQKGYMLKSCFAP